MNMRFKQKMLHSSGHRAKKTPENSTIFPAPYFGGELGRGMEKCGNKALMLEFLDRCGRILDLV
jgi:hypothetical protein